MFLTSCALQQKCRTPEKALAKDTGKSYNSIHVETVSVMPPGVVIYEAFIDGEIYRVACLRKDCYLYYKESDDFVE